VGYVLAASQGLDVIALVVEEEIPPGIAAPLPDAGRASYPDWHAPLLRAGHAARRLLAGRADDLHREFLLASARPEGLDPAAVAVYLEAYSADGQLDVDIGFYACQPTDLATIERLRRRRLEVPVLTIGGAYAMGYAVSVAFRQLATTVDHVQSECSGHYPIEQDPEVTVGPAVDFLLAAGPAA